jgi:hypothetical protein
MQRIIPERSYSSTVTPVAPEQSADNARLQAALDKAGTVEVPPGDYQIDCSKPLRVKSNTYLKISPLARFVAIAHGMQRSQMLLIENVSNVRVTGGIFRGERQDHDFSDESGTGTHEWNHCVAVYSSTKVTLESMDIADFTGDAMSIGGGGQGTKPPSDDVVISKIVGTNCYRQGLSITNLRNFYAYDCTFKATNGTSPECGIDIEPELGQVSENINIIGCFLAENSKYGLNILARTGTTNPGGTIRKVLVTECTIDHNKSNGFYAHNVTGLVVKGNKFLTNSATGAIFSACPDYVYQDNESGFNYARSPLTKPRVPFTQTGWTSKIQRDVLLKNGAPTTGCKLSKYL